MQIVDAHLDLAYNALRGRDVLRPAREQRANADGIPTVGLPDLRAGGVGLVCATIFCQPDLPNDPGYRTADEAYAMARQQLAWYEQQRDAAEIEIVTRGTCLQRVQASVPRGLEARATIKSILLLEGADAIRTPVDVRELHDAGVRIVGLAWRRTRYAGGTGTPGPLTPEGVELVRELDQFGIIHDASHLAEESFWELLDLTAGPVIASHSNCRAIVPTDRQLSDQMIRAIAARGGVIGINFYDKFLLPPDEYGKRRATLADVVRHVRHMCDQIGDSGHVGIGTDLDGGFSRDQIPVEIATAADLPRVGDALSSGGFDDEAVSGILGGNWVRCFEKVLPRKS